MPIGTSDDGIVASGKRIHKSHTGRLIVFDIASHHRQFVKQCRGRDLLVQRILRVRYSQAAPNVRCLLVEWKNRISVVIGNTRQPTPNASCLGSVASMTNSLDTLPQFTNRDYGQIERGVVATGVMKER